MKYTNVFQVFCRIVSNCSTNGSLTQAALFSCFLFVCVLPVIHYQGIGSITLEFTPDYSAIDSKELPNNVEIAGKLDSVFLKHISSIECGRLFFTQTVVYVDKSNPTEETVVRMYVTNSSSLTVTDDYEAIVYDGVSAAVNHIDKSIFVREVAQEEDLLRDQAMLSSFQSFVFSSFKILECIELESNTIVVFEPQLKGYGYGIYRHLSIEFERSSNKLVAVDLSYASGAIEHTRVTYEALSFGSDYCDQGEIRARYKKYVQSGLQGKPPSGYSFTDVRR